MATTAMDAWMSRAIRMFLVSVVQKHLQVCIACLSLHARAVYRFVLRIAP